MADLASLVVRLEAQSAQFQSELQKANRRLESWEGGVRKTLGQVRGLFGAIIPVSFGVALAGTIRNAVAFGDELDRMATKAGIGGGAMSELAYAAKLADVETSGLSIGLRKMQELVSQAGTGAKSATKVFQQLGLSLASIKRLSADEQLEAFADRLSSIKDPADRARFAVEIFGRSGADLLPLFEKGARGIREAREEAVKLGAALTDDGVKALAATDEQVKRLKFQFSGLATTLTSQVAPALSNFLESINLAFAAGDTRIAKLRNQIEFIEQQRDSFLTPEYKKKEDNERIAALQKELSLLLQADVVEKRRKGLFTPRSHTSSGIVNIAEPDKDVVQARERSAKDWLELVKDVNEKQVDIEADTYQLVSEEFERSVEERGNYLGGYIQVFEKHMDELGQVSHEKFDEISTYSEEAARNIQDSLANFLFDPFSDGLKGMLKGFVDTLRKMVAEVAASQILKKSGIQGFLETGVGALLGGFGGGLSEIHPTARRITGYAAGGSYGAGQPMMVGERGPELMIPSAAGRIVPNEKLGGATFAPVTNIDARGATQELASQLPGILAENNRRLYADFDRRFGIGR